MPGEIFIDCTIQLSNRTAVYFMADRLAELAAEVTGRPPLRRYWRLFTRRRLDILDTRRREQLALLAARVACAWNRVIHRRSTVSCSPSSRATAITAGPLPATRSTTSRLNVSGNTRRVPLIRHSSPGPNA
jgi:hypothetical protein